MAIEIQNATLEEVQDVYQNAYKVARALQEFNQGTDVPVGETGGHGRYTVAEMNSMIEALKTAVDAVDE